LGFGFCAHAASPRAFFQAGTAAYQTAEYSAAAQAFKDSAALEPASGTFQNLGLAEWELGQTGPAILAWEQSLWLNPLNGAAQGNLRFARKAAQVEAPDLTWYEVISTWLPVNLWAWVGALSFWSAISAALLPGIFRWRKAAWHQAVATIGLTVFLLTLPAFLGVHTRSRLGFIVQKDCPLRMTPTAEAQSITRLNSGDPARLQRARGDFVLVRTSRASGWVKKDQLGLIAATL
jgi:tetratricopeptide (TPR) repeat protein